jgi:hypothetical protein
MNKIRFVLPIAVAYGVISVFSVLSCSNVEEAIEQVQQAQCTSGQGEWDANIKKCVKCPEGTLKNANGQCDVPASDIKVIERDDGTSTIICPPRTKLNAVGTGCVADIIATDTNAVASVFYCDYGKPDPNEVDLGWGIDCYPIEYRDECDTDWGRPVKSCAAADRRKDLPYFCDYGPIDPKHGGGCYRILNNGNDCDTEWGIVARSCGTQGRWPDGTVCPTGKTKIQVGEINECRNKSDIGLTNGTYCDYGPFTLNNLNEIEGGCWAIRTQEDRNNCLRWGKGVNTCPSYPCPAGTITNPDGGCKLPATTCPTGYTLIAGECIQNTTPTCPTGFTLVNGSCVQNSTGCPSGSTLVNGSCVPSSPGTKYCFFGTETNCYAIGTVLPEDGFVVTEASCKESYGTIVPSCFNVVVQFCDYGQPILKNGDVDGGCYPIHNEDELSGCSTVVSTCPNYTCPAGYTKTDWGWPGQVGCVNDEPVTPFYCDYGYIHSKDADLQLDGAGGCFEVKNEEGCDLNWGVFVNSCKATDRRKDLKYCDYGPWNQWGGGCWPIRNDKDEASCDTRYANIVDKCLWLN